MRARTTLFSHKKDPKATPIVMSFKMSHTVLKKLGCEARMRGIRKVHTLCIARRIRGRLLDRADGVGLLRGLKTLSAWLGHQVVGLE